jgi:hypothetical protein
MSRFLRMSSWTLGVAVAESYDRNIAKLADDVPEVAVFGSEIVPPF